MFITVGKFNDMDSPYPPKATLYTSLIPCNSA